MRSVHIVGRKLTIIYLKNVMQSFIRSKQELKKNSQPNFQEARLLNYEEKLDSLVAVVYDMNQMRTIYLAKDTLFYKKHLSLETLGISGQNLKIEWPTESQNIS